MRNHLSLVYLSFFFYVLVVLALTIFSYSFTDPNLVLSSHPIYWQWQQWMWRTWFDHPPLQAQTYAILISASWLTFGIFGWSVWRTAPHLTTKKLVVCGTVLLSISLFSYNALSHDMFNYMFNARMVVAYNANPHQKVALDFVGDVWLRFMHNTHTPAPYGYGWTGISLAPYILGGGRFLPTWFLFRLTAMLPLIGLAQLQGRWLEKTSLASRRWLILLLISSPIVVTEVVASSHNDLWMMLPAVTSIYMLDQWLVKRRWRYVLAMIVLLGLSIAVKYATVVLVPLMVSVLLIELLKKRIATVCSIPRPSLSTLALFASILMTLPLLTARSQYFHSWYWLWPFVWLPLITNKLWQAVLWGFAISSTLRYLPWIFAGGFEGTVVWQQQLVTWIGGAICSFIIWLVLRRAKRSL